LAGIVRYWLVMPAAGASQRFGAGTAKQHALLFGRTVLELSLQLFIDDPRCAGIALALSAAGLTDKSLIARLAPKVSPIAGGKRRCDSVWAGLAALKGRAASDEWVLVHDAARPCLSEQDRDRLLAAGAQHPAGALLAAPVSDTLKRADAQSASDCTVDRKPLWRALTPQMFRYGALCQALQSAIESGKEPTDEAQAVEWQGGHPLLIAVKDSNPKITEPEDLAVAMAILSTRHAAVPVAKVAQ
jgi:2-C-methyl-D-erythritol 4-phosphate cytidylyltransferase